MTSVTSKPSVSRATLVSIGREIQNMTRRAIRALDSEIDKERAFLLAFTAEDGEPLLSHSINLGGATSINWRAIRERCDSLSGESMVQLHVSQVKITIVLCSEDDQFDRLVILAWLITNGLLELDGILRGAEDMELREKLERILRMN